MTKKLDSRLDRLEKRRRPGKPPRFDVRWPHELTTDASGQTIVKATGEPWPADIVLHWPKPPDVTADD